MKLKAALRTVGLLVGAVLIAVGAVVAITTWEPRTYRVTGVITRDGKPLKWKSKKHVLQIIFVPKKRTRESLTYRCAGDEEGRYEIKEIPADTYRVSIQQFDPYPKRDLLEQTYLLHNSPIYRDVSGDCEINIDLPK